MRSASAARLFFSLLLVVALTACSDSGSDKDTTSTRPTSTTSSSPHAASTSTAPTTTTAPATSTSVSPPPTTSASVPPPPPAPSNGWAVETFDAVASAAGTWAGNAVVRNTDATERSGDFIFTLHQGDQIVGRLTGSVGAVASGATAPVVLSSGDPYTPGAFTYSFESSFGF